MQTIDDEEEHLQSLRQANALFTYAESTLCIRLNTSEESRALKSCGPLGLTVNSVAYRIIYASSLMYSPVEGKQLMCPREASQALACLLNFYIA